MKGRQTDGTGILPGGDIQAGGSCSARFRHPDLPGAVITGSPGCDATSGRDVGRPVYKCRDWDCKTHRAWREARDDSTGGGGEQDGPPLLVLFYDLGCRCGPVDRRRVTAARRLRHGHGGIRAQRRPDRRHRRRPPVRRGGGSSAGRADTGTARCARGACRCLRRRLPARNPRTRPEPANPPGTREPARGPQQRP